MTTDYLPSKKINTGVETELSENRRVEDLFKQNKIMPQSNKYRHSPFTFEGSPTPSLQILIPHTRPFPLSHGVPLLRSVSGHEVSSHTA